MLHSYKIAVVGMACRFPGADDCRRYARNLREGGDHITRISRETLLSRGVPAARVDHARYVPARGAIDGFDLFDNEFFAISPADATAMDPQHRLFFMTAWHALEDAGHAAPRLRARAGVFGACSRNSYATSPAEDVRSLINDAGDHLSTRLSYKLNLHGPSMTVSTACSSSLVAVTQAVQALLLGQCDLALAGGASLKVPVEGYVFREGSILSPDGYCRAFDAKAAGTVPGDGAGVVVLRRLDEAVRAGDTIRAVISGFGLTNDGSDKVGYSAPSIAGQAAAITAAHTMADVGPADIGYLEAHGTGTVLGDAVEVTALREVFDAVPRERSCALGTVKSSIGHLDATSGVAGLIKAVLSVEQGVIYPHARTQTPHPELDLNKSPFHVPAVCEPWPANRRRRAGVSSFGVGGTNVHLVVEQAPEPPASPSRQGYWPLLVSAKNPESLRLQIQDLAECLSSSVGLADAAYTLAEGREAFSHRYAVLARDADQAARLLRAAEAGPGAATASARRALFEFPAASDVTPALVRELARGHAAFRAAWGVWEAAAPGWEADRWNERDRPVATCAFQYALACLWAAYGVEPRRVAAYGLGATAAAAFTGEITVEEAARLVAAGTGARTPGGSVEPGGPVESGGPVDGLRISMAAPGRVRVDGAAVPPPPAGADVIMATLTALWQAGADVRFGPLFAGGGFRRVPLPGYRFRARRHWAVRPQAAAAGESSAGSGRTGTPADSGAGQDTSDEVILGHVMDVWEEVLGSRPDSADADFYDAGGDSLAATELVAGIEERLDVPLGSDTVFSDPTPGALAGRIRSLLSADGAQPPAKTGQE
ncbi:beta-ketoacyl synthase N-terminal-like domain-containing protein [Streptomyces sp. NPDC050560]|uniref:beta-ketoacyl synthase N-terminal-like domain-containing protein n=1 Tax=Streptomyces sp. NPDC050560 TaxID=3365630 RepID=UPI0037B94D8A